MNEEQHAFLEQQQKELDLAQQQVSSGSGGTVNHDIAAAHSRENQRSDAAI